MTLFIIGGRWKVIILWFLFKGTKRFSDLRQSIEGITHKMLSQQLRELERDRVVRRQAHSVVPPKVEYSLSTLGKSLKPVVEAMHEWGRKHSPK